MQWRTQASGEMASAWRSQDEHKLREYKHGGARLTTSSSDNVNRLVSTVIFHRKDC